ncbi:hypothetical protein H8D30_06570 [bacterium]|nr:hypothetical protein [bacterium]
MNKKISILQVAVLLAALLFLMKSISGGISPGKRGSGPIKESHTTEEDHSPSPEPSNH